jgi:DEAD/DEAH box helicase
VISTPSRALALAQSKSLSLGSIDSLVIDEADLILSYGHDEDVRQLLKGSYLPKVHQSFLMSATMTDDVEMLKGLTLRNPVRDVGAPFPRARLTPAFLGDTKTRGRRRRGPSTHAIRCSLLGSRQIPSHLCDSQAQADQRQMHHLCQRCGPLLSSQALPGTILDQELCPQL